jgi:hypothetical protein
MYRSTERSLTVDAVELAEIVNIFNYKYARAMEIVLHGTKHNYLPILFKESAIGDKLEACVSSGDDRDLAVTIDISIQYKSGR